MVTIVRNIEDVGIIASDDGWVTSAIYKEQKCRLSMQTHQDGISINLTKTELCIDYCTRRNTEKTATIIEN